MVLSPEHAAARAIVDGEAVRVTTAHGSVEGRAVVTQKMRAGVVTLPHGYADTNVNDLTSSVDLDPLTGMPVYSGLSAEVVAV